MSRIDIPQKLIDMTRSRRVIPFIGTGFSSAFNVPDWDSLLKKLADEIDSAIPYEEVKNYCNRDPLQIAEYYLLVSDGRVGPIRHAISEALQTSVNPLDSGAHVELINLGASQIYTTNYDELIEKTFRALKQPIEVVSLPKHIAISSDAKSQVVKYHGDLRHEQTLVLTESSYYARLDLESPIDLKFRSDLLGRSVLFIGYSFRDINIRIIWFKLMRVMKDIPQEDRPISFIVTFSKNPVLSRLYEAVGIQTICLDPEGTATSSEEKTKLLSQFMFDLVRAAAPNGNIIGHTNQAMFFSKALSDAFYTSLTEGEKRGSFHRNYTGRTLAILAEFAKRSIPPAQKDAAAGIISTVSSSKPMSGLLREPIDAAINFVRHFGPDKNTTFIFILALTREFTREALLASKLEWPSILGGKLDSAQIATFVGLLDEEERFFNNGNFDPDLAYCIDIAKRILNGELSAESSSSENNSKISAILSRIELDGISNYSPKPRSAPLLEEIILNIQNEEEKKRLATSDDDVPF